MQIFPTSHDSHSISGTPSLVSIVIPCYHGERFLAEAIQSCLRQSYSALEVIVVDDLSPDSCVEIAESFAQADPRVRIVRRPQNGGVSRAFNDGFDAARGAFLTRLAQDDVFEPFAVERMVKRLSAAGPRAGLVYCDRSEIDDSGTFVQEVIRTPPPEHVLIYGNRMGLCVMWTREVWQTVGGFNPDFDAAEDYEYWCRVESHFKVVKSEGPPAMRTRTHAGMGSVVFAEKQIVNTYRVVRAAHGGQFVLNRKWWMHQIALARAHLTAAHSFREQQLFGKALVKMVLSFIQWPLPLPEHALTDERPWIRVRMFCVLSLNFLTSLVTVPRDKRDRMRERRG